MSASRPVTPAGAEAAVAADMAQIVTVLSGVNGNVSAAAEALCVTRRTLDRRITAFGLREWLTATYPLPGRQPARGRHRKKKETER